MLTYKVEKRVQGTGRVELLERNLVAPKDWQCYDNNQGNRSMTKKAENFLIKIEKIKESSLSVDFRMEKAIVAFIKSYVRFSNSNLGERSGASDSEVKWSVYDFLEKVSNAVGIYENEFNALWEKTYG